MENSEQNSEIKIKVKVEEQRQIKIEIKENITRLVSIKAISESSKLQQKLKNN